MNMKITDSAREQIRKAWEKGHYIKISVERSGCCSLAYQFYEDVQRKDDILVEVDGEKLLMTSQAKEMLEMQETKMDYKRKGVRKDFWITAR